MSIPIDIVVVEASKLASEQKQEIIHLQKQSFPDVSAEEIEEDFCRPPVAGVLAYSQGELVGCAEVFKREVEYEGQVVVVGGFGPCTKEDLRGQGIGTRVCEAAMEYLRGQGCDIAFLSVDTKRKSHHLYERLGFKMLAQPFVYANVRGELKESDGGMVAPLCSREWFERVLYGKSRFDLTPEVGYW